MIPNPLHHVRQQARESRLSASAIACVLLLALSIVSGVAVAQSQQQTFSDDFEDQSVDGWQSPQGQTPQVSSDATVGDYSLLGETETLPSQPNPTFQWVDGPVLDMQDGFRIEGVAKPNHRGSEHTIRIGVSGGQQGTAGENAFLIFDNPNGRTFLATSTNEAPASNQTLSNSFDEQWVHFVMESDADDDELRAKVWAVGDEEPSSFNLQADGFEGISGLFGVNPGVDNDNPRSIYLDEVSITGSEATDPALDLQHNNLLLPGEQTEYTVTYKQFNDRLGRNQTTDVTDDPNTTVESLNTSALTVDESAHTLQATSDESVALRVETRAQYNGSVTYSYVTVVPEVTTEYLEILPPEYRITAFLGNWTVFLLLIAIGAGIIGTRAATSFMGLSMMEIVLITGWFGGYLSRGLMLVSVFAALFIGLNLAANIDYQVQR